MSEPEITDQPLPLVAHLTRIARPPAARAAGRPAGLHRPVPFANEIYTFVSEPLRKLLPGRHHDRHRGGLALPDPFKLTLVTAVFIAIPFVLYQAWSFIALACTNTKTPGGAAAGFQHRAVLCRAAFAYFRGIPADLRLFTSTGPADITIMTDINSYLDFVLKLFFAFGLAFEIPIAAVLLI